MSFYINKLSFKCNEYDVSCDCVVNEKDELTKEFTDEMNSEAIQKIVLEFFAGLNANVKDLSAAGHKALRQSISFKFVDNTSVERICALSAVLHRECVKRRYYDTEKEMWDSLPLPKYNSLTIHVRNKDTVRGPTVRGAFATVGYNSCSVEYANQMASAGLPPIPQPSTSLAASAQPIFVTVSPGQSASSIASALVAAFHSADFPM